MKYVTGLLVGLILGASTPYLFHLLAMTLRHCGGM